MPPKFQDKVGHRRRIILGLNGVWQGYLHNRRIWVNPGVGVHLLLEFRDPTLGLLTIDLSGFCRRATSSKSIQNWFSTDCYGQKILRPSQI
jgi:hypothetical protein